MEDRQFSTNLNSRFAEQRIRILTAIPSHESRFLLTLQGLRFGRTCPGLNVSKMPSMKEELRDSSTLQRFTLTVQPINAVHENSKTAKHSNHLVK